MSAPLVTGPAVALPTNAQKPIAPDWVHLLPAGEIATKDGRGPYILNDTAAVIALSQQVANNRNLPIDYDHQIDLAPKQGGRAPAAGWIVEMQARADGIWGRVEWTREGGRRVAEREYRFLSPVFAHTPNNEVMMIARASVTNNPNLPQLVALNSAGHRMDPESFLASLRKKLSLPQDADHAAIIAAVDALLTSRNSADPKKFVPMDLFQKAVAEAAKANLGLSRHAAEEAVNEAALRGKVLPFMKDWAINLCMADKAGFDSFISQISGPMTSIFAPSGLNYADREAALHHRQGDARTTTDNVAARLGLTDEDFTKYGQKP